MTEKRELIRGNGVKIIGYHRGPRIKENKDLIGSTGRVLSISYLKPSGLQLFRIKTPRATFYYTRDNLRALPR